MEFSIEAKLGDEFQKLDDGMRRALLLELASIQQGTKDEWLRIAQARLKSTRADYVQGLQHGETLVTRVIGVNTVFEVQLVGKMPNNIEFGMASFDMKTVRPGWLGGSKAKTSKDGTKYVTIPFRHSLSSAAHLAYTGKAKQQDLKKKLTQVVKDYGLDRMARAASGAVIAGPTSRVPNNAPVHPYLKGLTRIQNPTQGKTKSGQGRGSSQLLTWRVMSEKSKPDAWIHPGIKAANLLPEVEKWVDNELDRIIDSIMRGT